LDTEVKLGFYLTQDEQAAEFIKVVEESLAQYFLDMATVKSKAVREL